MDEVIISPSAGYIGLRLFAPERFNGSLEYFKLEAGDLEALARVRVYAYEASHLAEFFAGLAREWAGWEGERRWESLEGEARFSATADGKGHVTLHVSLEPPPYPRPWKFQGNVLIEAGQLDRLSSEVRQFVEGAG